MHGVVGDKDEQAGLFKIVNFFEKKTNKCFILYVLGKDLEAFLS